VRETGGPARVDRGRTSRSREQAKRSADDVGREKDSHETSLASERKRNRSPFLYGNGTLCHCSSLIRWRSVSAILYTSVACAT
jgi:hypothetical protein